MSKSKNNYYDEFEHHAKNKKYNKKKYYEEDDDFEFSYMGRNESKNKLRDIKNSYGY